MKQLLHMDLSKIGPVDAPTPRTWGLSVDFCVFQINAFHDLSPRMPSRGQRGRGEGLSLDRDGPRQGEARRERPGLLQPFRHLIGVEAKRPVGLVGEFSELIVVVC